MKVTLMNQSSFSRVASTSFLLWVKHQEQTTTSTPFSKSSSMADLFPGVIFPSTSRVQWKSTMTFPFLKGVACSTCSFLTDAADAAGAAGASADAAGAAGAPDAAAGAADASADAAGATGAADAAGAAGAACPFSKGSCPPVVVPFSKGASSFAFSSGILHSPFFHCSFHARQVLLLPFSSTPSSPLAPCSWRTMPWRHHSPCCPWSCWSCSCSFPFPLVWEVLVAFSFCHLPAPPPPHPRHPSPSTHHLFPKSLPIHLFPKSFSSFSTNLFPKSNHFPMSHLPKSHLPRVFSRLVWLQVQPLELPFGGSGPLANFFYQPCFCHHLLQGVSYSSSISSWEN